MRKLLAILLISLLSLQASWTAAASYCGHEQGSAARHFGHHEHEHRPQPAQLAAQAEAAPATHSGADVAKTSHGTDATQGLADNVAASLVAADLDCSVCHAHALSGVPSALVLPASDVPALYRAALIQHQPPSVTQPRPERPNWFAA